MGKFQIATPGGFEVEVQADDQAAALDIARRDWQTLPRIIGKFDGNVRVFEKDGRRYAVSPSWSTTDPAKIDKILEGEAAGDVSKSSIRQGVIDAAPVTARASELVRGTPFIGSYLDEAIGGLYGGDAAAASRMLHGAMQAEKPLETMGLNLGGGLLAGGPIAAAAMPAGAGSAIAGGGGRLAQMGRGLAAGAAAGGLEGAAYGSGEGVAGTRGKESARGAGIGAIFGGGFGGAAPLVKEGADNLISLFRRSDIAKIAKDLGISTDAAKVIKSTFDVGGDFTAARQNLARAGSEGMLADAGHAGQALLDAAGVSGGRAGQIASDAIEGRTQRSGARLTGLLDEKLGAPQASETLVGDIMSSSRTARGDAYDAAYGQEIDWLSPSGEKLRGLLDTTPTEVISRAQRIRSMKPGEVQTGPDYSDYFADRISTASGTPAHLVDEAAEVGSFFDEVARLEGLAGRNLKRPLTAFIKKKGGVDPRGLAAVELKARGVTPQTHPGLFKRGGMMEMDNLDASEFDEGIRYGVRDGTAFADPEQIYEGLIDEGAGRAVRSVDDSAVMNDLDQLDRMRPEYEARRAALAVEPGPNAPAAPSELAPTATVRDVDMIKRTLDDIRRDNEGLGQFGLLGEYGRGAGDRAKAIRDTLGENVGAYLTALETAADPIARREAVGIGEEFLKPAFKRVQAEDFLKRASGGEVLAARQGIRAHIDEVLNNVRVVPSDPNVDARQTIAAVKELGTPAARAKISMLLKDDAPELLNALDEATASLNLRAATATNSKTFPRMAAEATVDEITAPGVVGQAMQGEPINATKAAVQAITGHTSEYSNARKQEIFQDIARALTAKRGPDAQAALSVLEQAMSGQQLTDKQTSDLAGLISGVLFAGSQQGLTRYEAGQQRGAQ